MIKEKIHVEAVLTDEIFDPKFMRLTLNIELDTELTLAEQNLLRSVVERNIRFNTEDIINNLDKFGVKLE